MKIRIGIICPSEIALRRFMPALVQSDNFVFAGIAVADASEWCGQFNDEIKKAETEKANVFIKEYGGKLFLSYKELIHSNDVDAVYIPLPPALHFKWGCEALKCKKHVLTEKPSCTSLSETQEMIRLSKENNCAIHENYMFVFHRQIDRIKEMLSDGIIGDVRLYRLAFGFPKRKDNDFRYVKSMGGGALLDCAGYPVKLADMLLDNAFVATSQLSHIDGYEVDMFGSATISGKDGITAQLSFGMDNSYKCEFEAWGSKGTIYANRIFTAPAGFEPIITCTYGNDVVEKIRIEADDTFKKSIDYFEKCIKNEDILSESRKMILKQSALIEKIAENERRNHGTAFDNRT